MSEHDIAAAGEIGGEHTHGLHFKVPGGPGSAQQDSLVFDGDRYWSTIVPEVVGGRSGIEQQLPNAWDAVEAAAEPVAPKNQGSMSFYKTKLQAVIWELRGAMSNLLAHN